MTTYQKYVDRLKSAMLQVKIAATAIEQAPLMVLEEDIDARIRAAEAIVKHCQSARRDLLYFKNKLARQDILPR